MNQSWFVSISRIKGITNVQWTEKHNILIAFLNVEQNNCFIAVVMREDWIQ